MENIAIYGAGGFGREIVTLINQINIRENTYNFIGFFDDGKSRGDTINGYPVLGGIKELNLWENELSVVVAIALPEIKRKVIGTILNDKISFPTIVHPSVIIGDNDSVQIGQGCIICAGCIITCNIEIKKFVIINLACTIGHDTIIEDYSSFMPTVNISGEVLIKEGVYVGTGAKIINQLEVGRWAIIGAGAVVVKGVPDYCTAVGIPAKPIKFKNK